MLKVLGTVFIDAPIIVGASADRYPMRLNPIPGLYDVGIDTDTGTISLTPLSTHYPDPSTE